MNRDQITLSVAIFFGFVIIGIPSTMYYCNFGNGLSDENADWGTLGDFLNVFVALASLLITTVAAIVVVGMSSRQQKIDRLEADLATIRKLQIDTLKVFTMLTLDVVDTYEKWSKGLNDYVSNFEESDNALLSLVSAYSNLSLDYLHSKMDKSAVYIACHEQMKNYDVVQIYSTLEFFKSVYDEIARVTLEMRKNEFSRLNESKQQIDSLQDQVRGIIIGEIGPSEYRDRLRNWLQSLVRIINEHKEKSISVDPMLLCREVIKPLDQILTDFHFVRESRELLKPYANRYQDLTTSIRYNNLSDLQAFRQYSIELGDSVKKCRPVLDRLVAFTKLEVKKN